QGPGRILQFDSARVNRVPVQRARSSAETDVRAIGRQESQGSGRVGAVKKELRRARINLRARERVRRERKLIRSGIEVRKSPRWIPREHLGSPRHRVSNG